MEALAIGGFKLTSRRLRGWFGSAFLLAAVAAAAVSRPMVTRGGTADTVIDALAWVALVVGGLIRLWATLYIGGRKSKELATEGPYSLCRNPLYVGSMLMGVSLALSLKSVAVLVGLAGAGLVYATYLVPHEEQVLEQIFGDAYRRYRARTAAFVPGWREFRQFHTAAVIRVRIQGLARELSRAVWWPLVPFAGDLVAALHTIPGWPHLFNGI